MTVTCVIPTHARSGLLRQALESVAAQVPVPPDEIVIVDDCADEPTAAAIADVQARYPGLRIALIDGSGPNSGASRSRNLGVAHSTGDLLFFLDDDDVWSPNHLASLESALVPGVDIAVSWMTKQTEDGTTSEYFEIAPGLTAADVIAVNPGVTGSNLAIRRSAFELVGGFDELLPVSNDKDFFVRCLDSNLRYAVVSERTVCYRLHTSEQLTDWDSRRARAMKVYLRKYQSRLSLGDRRFLSGQIFSAYQRSSTGVNRWYWGMLRVFTLSARDLQKRLRRTR